MGKECYQKQQEVPENVQIDTRPTIQGPKFKFGIQVPRSKKEALELDLKNDNNVWAGAMETGAKVIPSGWLHFLPNSMA